MRRRDCSRNAPGHSESELLVEQDGKICLGASCWDDVRAALWDELQCAFHLKGQSLEKDSRHGFWRVASNGSSNEDLYVSFSHTADVMIGCLGRFPVGIDLEKRDRDVQRVAKRFSTLKELGMDHFETLEGKEYSEIPLAVWCGKEALGKALGIGMKYSWRSVSVLMGNGPHCSLEGELPKGIFSLSAPTICYLVVENYLIAICTEAKVLSQVGLAGSGFSGLGVKFATRDTTRLKHNTRINPTKAYP